MPMVNVTMPVNALDEAQRAALSEKLTHVLLMIEGGVDNREARSIAWVLFHEVKAAHWAVGGSMGNEHSVEGGRFLITVTVPEAALSAERKARVVEAVHVAVRDVLGLPHATGENWAPWVIINEVTDGNWGAGGAIRRLPEIAGYARVTDPAIMAHTISYLETKGRLHAEAGWPA